MSIKREILEINDIIAFKNLIKRIRKFNEQQTIVKIYFTFDGENRYNSSNKIIMK